MKGIPINIEGGEVDINKDDTLSAQDTIRVDDLVVFQRVDDSNVVMRLARSTDFGSVDIYCVLKDEATGQTKFTLIDPETINDAP